MEFNFESTLPLRPPGGGEPARPKGPAQTLAGQLGDTFSTMLAEVNQQQMQADRKIAEFATSPEQKDIHGTMVAMEKAGTSLRLLLQVRSKLTSAYQELMRMQF